MENWYVLYQSEYLKIIKNIIFGILQHDFTSQTNLMVKEDQFEINCQPSSRVIPIKASDISKLLVSLLSSEVKVRVAEVGNKTLPTQPVIYVKTVDAEHVKSNITGIEVTSERTNSKRQEQKLLLSNDHHNSDQSTILSSS